MPFGYGPGAISIFVYFFAYFPEPPHQLSPVQFSPALAALVFLVFFPAFLQLL